MKQPDCALWEKGYQYKWKAWLGDWMKCKDYPSLEAGMRDTMQETKGKINPQWIKEAWEKLHE